MMGGGAFELLKAGDIGSESAKQLKISLAGFLKILSNPGTSAGLPYRWDGA
jgi:hypothetical protein